MVLHSKAEPLIIFLVRSPTENRNLVRSFTINISNRSCASWNENNTFREMMMVNNADGHLKYTGYRQTEGRQTVGLRDDRRADRRMDRYRDRQMDRSTDGLKDEQADRRTKDDRTDRKTYRQEDNQADRRMKDRQADRSRR